jgi:hypothetical protein
MPKLKMCGIDWQYMQEFRKQCTLVQKRALQFIHKIGCQRGEDASPESDSHRDPRCPGYIQ